MRECRGESEDEACRECEGSGKYPIEKAMGHDLQCTRCDGFGKQKKNFPLIVTGIKWAGKTLRPALFSGNTTWVSGAYRTSITKEIIMGFVLTATNARGVVSTFWVPSTMIQEAYKSFGIEWTVECSKLMSRKPKNVQYHIKDRL